MAKKQTDAEKKVAVGFKTPKADGPRRSKRNTFQRKCLSKAMKRMFSDVPSSVRNMLVKFEQANKSRSMA